MDETVGFLILVALAALAVVAMAFMFVVLGAFTLIVLIAAIIVLILSPWFVKGFLRGWRDARKRP